ncbi:hypothetical protein OAM67_00580 [bacterium]|nr:hypothetical protein [bacterium]
MAEKKQVAPMQPQTNVELVLPNIFGYGDQGVDDHGWGCVYRCVQTVQRYWHKRVMTVPQMRTLSIKHGGKPTADSNLKNKSITSLWIEPPCIRKCYLLPKTGRVVLFCPGDPTQFLQKSPIISNLTDFDCILRTKEEWWTFLGDRLRTQKSPVIIDDKVCSYVVYGFDQDDVLIGDPHFPDRELRRRKISLHLLLNKPWMAYSVL